MIASTVYWRLPLLQALIPFAPPSVLRDQRKRLPVILLGSCAVLTACAVSTPGPTGSVASARKPTQDTAVSSVPRHAAATTYPPPTAAGEPSLAEPVADFSYSIDAVNLPLQVMLYSLAEKANLELSQDAQLDQTITLRVVDKPVEEVLDLLARQSGIRWQIDKGVLSIASVEPYLDSYSVDYLNMSRSAVSRVGLATQVGSINLSADAGASASGFSNSSQSLIENQSSHHFWESLSADLQRILMLQPQHSDVLMLNRDTGIVTLRGSAQQHREVKAYLDKVQEVAQRQVLIEATVVEVTLSDEYQAGIDWRLLAERDKGFSGAQVFHGQAPPLNGDSNILPAPSALLSAIHQSNTLGRLSATLQLLQGFGNVRILSRPQIIAINNQSAILKVVDNRVYFTMSVERQSLENQDDITTSTQIHTVPVGLVMNVTPYIGADNTVILNVRPTISRILGFVNDPNPELALAQVRNGVPEIQIREMESVLKVPDGQIAMIGGLMQQQHNSGNYSLPVLSELPLLGALFRNKSRRGRKTELLVFLQPTVLEHHPGGRHQHN